MRLENGVLCAHIQVMTLKPCLYFYTNPMTNLSQVIIKRDFLQFIGYSSVWAVAYLAYKQPTELIYSYTVSSLQTKTGGGKFKLKCITA